MLKNGQARAGLSILLMVLVPVSTLPQPSWAQESKAPPQAAASQQTYKIEILSAAGSPKKRKKNTISSESVIRVTDSNDVPVAGASVMFAIAQLSGGSAAFANGAISTIVATNAAGIATTGAMTAAATSTFNIAVTASIAGQAAVSTTIPVSMTAVAAGAAAGGAGGAAGGGAAAGGAAGGAGGVSGALVGVVAAAAAGAAIAAKVLSGDDPITNKNTTRTVRIGGPGTPSVTGQ